MKTKRNKWDSSCTLFKDNLDRFFINTPVEDSYLTKREVECLIWIALGKSSQEVADILMVSHRTVETHLVNIKQKFNCNKISQIIYVAARAHII